MLNRHRDSAEFAPGTFRVLPSHRAYTPRRYIPSRLPELLRDHHSRPPRIVRFRAVSFTQHRDQQPASLQLLWRGLARISGGDKIIPAGLREPLIDADIPDSAYFDAADTNDRPRWRCPPLDLVQETLARAATCLDEREGESSWNVEVHAPLLSFWVDFPILHLASISPSNSTSAQIVQAFKPKNAPSRNVDFCIMIRPQEASPEHEAIETLCRCRHGQTINHTDWGNLCKDPIAISIETKRQGENWDNAFLQMGTWQSAKWRSLHSGRERKLLLSSIEFMPGIIIQRHSWLFVATTLRSQKATLHHHVAIGDTGTELTIYKLVMSLQYLQRWVEESYWPGVQNRNPRHSLRLGMNEIPIQP
ncbi:hypothetical protein AK830_g4250 [Neonectria ditissima]|uniref:PD-(D/E)XK nuclease-like domain-containing protein n=1 Tax=Neonectria ditissima TaxID=78410 RepID=A0A0P7BNF3_9HYPO|nr:hypothetical protein AK830_g4250 [Neonectria ditissima]